VIVSRLLLVYPRFPETFWGYQRALKMLGLRASHPPLGLLTVAGLLPTHHQLRLLDLNVEEATDEHWRWADLVLTGGMMIQRPSVDWIIEQCLRAGTPVVVGGPDATACGEEIHRNAHLVRGEAENPRLIEALEEMLTADRRIVLDLRQERIAIDESPLPRYDLLELRHYGSMALQMSRGCPFKCEFCDIPSLYGNRTRYKSVERTLAELDLIYDQGWRGSVFWVDDNFIGNKRSAKQILPHVREWQRRHGVPYRFYTQASVDLAGDPAALDLMAQAGFDSVFLGIETPVEECLQETRKLQNVRVDLLESVRTIQRAGLQVMAGFIVGFDNDPPDVDRHIVRFIQEAGVPTAMTGLMLALPGSPLYERLRDEGRLLDVGAEKAGNNTFEFGFAFETVLDPEILIDAYKRVLHETYGKPESYFRRVETMYRNLGVLPYCGQPPTLNRITALLRSLLMIPWSGYGRSYGRFLIRTLQRYPRRLPDAVRHGVVGVHFHRLTRDRLAAHEFGSFVSAAVARVHEACDRGQHEGFKVAVEVLEDGRRRLRKIPRAVRAEVKTLYEELELAVQRLGVARKGA
jgi:radical SAM superfamily enzyme YgiQ (UPF0313 family)